LKKKVIRIATRHSPLALWQAEWVAKVLRNRFLDIETELVKMVTKGDKILDAPLAKVGGKGLFVKELEQGLLEGRADIAVHSMKDVPIEFPPGLQLTAILEREDPTDALVSNHDKTLAELPPNAKIGTSSLRRQCQLKASFPGFEILSLRGNVNTRLAKLDDGQYDAIILASAGLKRLGFAERITQRLATKVSLPAVGQGAIGVESRIDDADINDYLLALHHQETALRVEAERAMNGRLQGGCQVPIAGFAEIQGKQMIMRGLVGSPDGSILYRATEQSDLTQAKQIGYTIADKLIAQGADKILQAVYARD